MQTDQYALFVLASDRNPPRGDLLKARQGQYAYFPFNWLGHVMTADASVWSGGNLPDVDTTIRYVPDAQLLLDAVNGVLGKRHVLIGAIASPEWFPPGGRNPVSLTPLNLAFLNKCALLGFDLVDEFGTSALTNEAIPSETDATEIADIAMTPDGLISSLEGAQKAAEWFAHVPSCETRFSPVGLWRSSVAVENSRTE